MKKKLFLVLSILAYILVTCVCLVGCKHEHKVIDYDITKNPTCNTIGKKIAVCECGERFGEEIEVAPLGHDLIPHEAQAETCLEIGWGAYDTCSRCEYTTYRKISALGHNYSDEWEIDVEPTQSTTGERSKHCSQCESRIEISEIPVLPYSDGLKYEQNTDGSFSVVGVDDESLIQDGVLNISPTYKGAEVTRIVSVGDLSITEIIIPDTVTSISNGALTGCTNIESLTLPFLGETKYSSEKSHLGFLFGATNNSSNQLTVPTSVTTVKVNGGVMGIRAFSRCSSLTDVELGNGITEIANEAFLHCGSLTDVKIGNNLSSIGDKAFSNCTNLTEIELGDKVTEIGEAAFETCHSLESITIPDSVMHIGDYAFHACLNLTNITIGNNINTIGSGMFIDCRNLNSIIIGSGLITVEDSAFGNCNNLTTVYYNGTEQEWSEISIANDYGNRPLTSATMYYYSETEPEVEGNYWHYDTDGITPIIWIKQD